MHGALHGCLYGINWGDIPHFCVATASPSTVLSSTLFSPKIHIPLWACLPLIFHGLYRRRFVDQLWSRKSSSLFELWLNRNTVRVKWMQTSTTTRLSCYWRHTNWRKCRRCSTSRRRTSSPCFETFWQVTIGLRSRTSSTFFRRHFCGFAPATCTSRRNVATPSTQLVSASLGDKYQQAACCGEILSWNQSGFQLVFGFRSLRVGAIYMTSKCYDYLVWVFLCDHLDRTFTRRGIGLVAVAPRKPFLS